MPRTRGLAVLAVVAIAGLVPASALASAGPGAHGRAPAAASGPAETAASAGVPGGTQLWASRYRDHTQQNYAFRVAVSPDGSTVFVTGASDLAHFVTVAYKAATGARRWIARYYGLGDSAPVSIAVAPDGSKVFVSGFTAPAGNALPGQFAIVAYNAATGATLWTHHPFDRTGGSEADSVAVSPDSSAVFVTGPVGGASPYLATIAYDAATGARLWQASYPSASFGAAPASVSVSPGGGQVFVTAPVKSATGTALIVTLAYNAATGAALWSRTSNGTTAALAVSPDGSEAFVTGSATTASGVSVFATTAYTTADGTELWAQSYQSPAGNSSPNAIAVSPDGSQLFVAGSNDGGSSGVANYLTVAYAAATGSTLWIRAYSEGGATFGQTSGAEAIGVSPDGGLVFVTGGTRDFDSSSVTNLNYTTVAYRAATGQTSWVARYGGPRDFGVATSLAVSPTGRALFVTGRIGVHDGCCDFGTVAYSP